MKTSESIKELAPALLKAQKGIKAALKDSTNPHFKSKYADLSSVIDAVKAALNDQGILFTQGVEGAESGVAVETRLIHQSGEFIASTITVPVVKNDAQGVGSAITYGRRYGLQAICGVPAEDDDGNAATKAGEVKKVDGTTRPAKNALETAKCPQELTQEEFQHVTDTVKAVMAWLAEGSVTDAVLTYDNANFFAEQQVFFWTFFDSKQRTAMKLENERLTKQHKEAA